MAGSREEDLQEVEDAVAAAKRGEKWAKNSLEVLADPRMASPEVAERARQYLDEQG